MVKRFEMQRLGHFVKEIRIDHQFLDHFIYKVFLIVLCNNLLDHRLDHHFPGLDQFGRRKVKMRFIRLGELNSEFFGQFFNLFQLAVADKYPLAKLIDLNFHNINHIDPFLVFLRSLNRADDIHFFSRLMVKNRGFNRLNNLFLIFRLKNQAAFHPIDNKYIRIVFAIHDGFDKRMFIKIQETHQIIFGMHNQQSIKKGTGHL